MRSHVTKLLLTLALVLGGASLAADLPRFLPSETLFAFGVEGLSAHEAKARPFIDEWERLDLTALLEAAFAEEVGEEAPDVPDIGAGFLDLLGREAWLTVSASQFNPLPAVTLMARVTPDGMAAVQRLLADLDAEGEVTEMTEGGVTFRVVMLDDEDALAPAIAYATFDDVVLASSNPDVTRGVLRRYQGAQEPSLATNSGYLATVGALRSGNTYTFLDLAAAADVAAPFAAGTGFDALVERVSAAADTAGVWGTTSTITDDGFETVAVRVLGSPSGDPRLYGLLTGGDPVSDRVLAFVPPTALGVTVATADLPGWWAWLEDVVTSEPAIGITDLDQIVMDSVGLDTQRTLFGWMGDEFGTITLGFGQASAMPTDLTNPLGESVYLVEATDEAAAAAGLNELFTLATGFASMMMDPMGEGAMVEPAQRQVAGVDGPDQFGVPGRRDVPDDGDVAVVTVDPAAVALARAHLTAHEIDRGLRWLVPGPVADPAGALRPFLERLDLDPPTVVEVDDEAARAAATTVIEVTAAASPATGASGPGDPGAGSAGRVTDPDRGIDGGA